MTMNETTIGLMLLGIGILSMIGAALNWRIVTHSGKLLNRIFGNTVARVIYFVLGILIFVVGIGRLIGADWL